MVAQIQPKFSQGAEVLKSSRYLSTRPGAWHSLCLLATLGFTLVTMLASIPFGQKAAEKLCLQWIVTEQAAQRVVPFPNFSLQPPEAAFESSLQMAPLLGPRSRGVPRRRGASPLLWVPPQWRLCCMSDQLLRSAPELLSFVPSPCPPHASAKSGRYGAVCVGVTVSLAVQVLACES